MKTVKFGDKEVRFDIIQGKIYDLEKKTKTSVSGGGGMTIRGTGATRRVSTTHSEHVEFWVKTDDGKEMYFKESPSVPLRNGHDVKIHYSVLNNSPSAIKIANLTTGETYTSKPEKLGCFIFFLLLLTCIFSVIGGALLTLLGSRESAPTLQAIGSIVIFGLGCYFIYKKHSALKTFEQEKMNFINTP